MPCDPKTACQAHTYPYRVTSGTSLRVELRAASSASSQAMNAADATVRNADVIMAMAMAMLPALARRMETHSAAWRALQHRAGGRSGMLTTAAKGTHLPRPEGLPAAENVIHQPKGAPAPVLAGISFRIKPGTIIGIIGPTGAGKSTLARCIVGSASPSSRSKPENSRCRWSRLGERSTKICPLLDLARA